MNPKHLEILQHALGTDQYGILPKYHESRNWYFTDANDADCLELVELGYMEIRPARSWLPDTMFAVTEAGKEAMRIASPAPPKVTRSQKRYQDFLDASDCWNCTFREYLDIIRTDWFKEMKGQDAGR